MTTSLDLLDRAQTALLDTTAAGARVLKPGDWPAWDSQYPVLKLRVASETKQSLGLSGPPQFAVTTTVSILGQVTGLADIDDGGAAAVEDALWSLSRQVEVAVIGDPSLGLVIQQWTAVRSRLVFSAEGEKHLAGIEMEFDLLFYQGPDDFAPIAANDLDEISLSVPTFTPSPGVVADLNP